MLRYLLLVLLAIPACIVRKPDSASKFIIFHGDKRWLINRVHKPFWKIRYHFVDCPPPTAAQKAHYQQIVTKFIQVWLQPLREYTKRAIVDDFRYEEKTRHASGGYDLGITDTCKHGLSRAFIDERWIKLNRGGSFKLTWRRMAVLLHELGHLFGLADTYKEGVPGIKPEGETTGGREDTLGSQPVSFMVGYLNSLIFGLENMVAESDKPVALDQPITLPEDDKNGIIWAYKHNVEGVRRDDCSRFPEYRWEATKPLGGCVPKFTLIFALKHHREHQAVSILKEDAGLAVNSQDPEGLTALHWAVLNNYRKVIAKLLDHPQIKPHLSDKEGKTAAELAKETGQADIAAQILAHPRALSVSPKGKKPLTWGELKRPPR